MTARDRASANANAPRVPIATARRASALTMSLRRGSRSDRAPLKRRRTSCGSVVAMPTIDIAVGTFEIAYVCQTMATR